MGQQTPPPPPPPPPPTQPPPPGSVPPQQPPGVPPQQPYGGQTPPPGYGAPPPTGGGGFPMWAIIAIIVAVVAIAAAVTVIVLAGGDEPEPPTPALESPGSPVPAPTDTALSPIPGSPSSPAAPATADCAVAPPPRLIECVPQKIEAFELIEWDNAPQFAQTFNANTAIETEFRRPDGKQILHYIFSYNTHTEAAVERDNYVRAFENIGFVKVSEERSRGINVARLTDGTEEVLVWSNGLIMAVVEGPIDVAAGFYLSLAY
ncbi:MAG: hypothetical protein M3135_05255 [Actinomycetota bacterium]|nr:hypothetical protein [Actinomycetota bacterium]